MRPTSSSKRAAAITLIALFVLSCVPSAYAHRHHQHKSFHQPIDLSNNSLTTACDFDADVRQDRVTLQSKGYDKTIKIRFGDARRSQLAFTALSDNSGRLVAGDIDQDGDVDLVWVGAVDRQDAIVLINDGEGNFAEATDISPYASELDGLFSSNDPTGNHKLKRGRKSSSLVSASFHDGGLPVLTWFQSATISLAPVSAREPLNVQSHFVPYLRKRGPPLAVS